MTTLRGNSKEPIPSSGEKSINAYLSGALSDGLEKCTLDNYEKFGGTVMEWLIIEILIFSLFTFTMCLIMVKSRFMIVGTDNTS